MWKAIYLKGSMVGQITSVNPIVDCETTNDLVAMGWQDSGDEIINACTMLPPISRALWIYASQITIPLNSSDISTIEAAIIRILDQVGVSSSSINAAALFATVVPIPRIAELLKSPKKLLDDFHKSYAQAQHNPMPVPKHISAAFGHSLGAVKALELAGGHYVPTINLYAPALALQGITALEPFTAGVINVYKATGDIATESLANIAGYDMIKTEDALINVIRQINPTGNLPSLSVHEVAPVLPYMKAVLVTAREMNWPVFPTALQLLHNALQGLPMSQTTLNRQLLEYASDKCDTHAALKGLMIYHLLGRPNVQHI